MISRRGAELRADVVGTAFALRAGLEKCAPSVGRVKNHSRRRQGPLRSTCGSPLTPPGSSGPGRPTETGRADRLSGHQAQPRGAAPDPGAPGRIRADAGSNVSGYPFETREAALPEAAASFPTTLLRLALI